MKKLIALLLSLVLVLGLVACGGDEAPETTAPKADAPETTPVADEGGEKTGDWVVGYICKDLSQEWFQATLAALEETCLANGAKEVIALDCEMNPEKCLNHLDNLIAQEVDIIVICTPDQQLSQTIVDRCNAAGIPVFADADGLIVDGKHIAPALELDAYTVGYGMGEWLANYVNTEMDYAADAEVIGYMRMTMNEVSSCVPRAEGAKDAFLAGVSAFNADTIYDANYDGTTEDGVADEDLPYDMKAGVIDIPDEHIPTFYIDSMDHPDRYDRKTIRLVGQVFSEKGMPKGYYLFGRMAMTCCADDIAPVGWITQGLQRPSTRAYVKLTASCKKVTSGGEAMLMLTEVRVEPAAAPKEKYLSFN